MSYLSVCFVNVRLLRRRINTDSDRPSVLPDIPTRLDGFGGVGEGNSSAVSAETEIYQFSSMLFSDGFAQDLYCIRIEMKIFFKN